VNSRDQSDLYSGIYCGIFTNDYSANAGQVMMTKITKTEGEWKACLTPEQFEITRKHGTERAFSGPHQNEKRAGIFKCVGCDNPLFDCHTKYDSGTGWPSFFTPIDDNRVSKHDDHGWFSRRTEIRCAECHAHLGHVFGDGPKPTGQRYCINGHALTFIAANK
jgi:peptide-methionine (R)-S-oxide reductase